MPEILSYAAGGQSINQVQQATPYAGLARDLIGGLLKRLDFLGSKLGSGRRRGSYTLKLGDLVDVGR